MEPLKEFRPVPLQPVLQAAQKNDVRAIYRRPRRTTGPYDEEIHLVGDDGMPLWDLTTPLPVQRHQDWLKKGYEYVTLSDRPSLDKTAPYLREMGLNPADYVQHPHFGAWNPKLYAATAAEGDRTALLRMFEMLDKYGVETYEEISGTKVSPALLASWTKSRAAVAGPAPATPASEPRNVLDRAVGAVVPKKAAAKKKPAAAATKPKPAAAPSTAAATITPPGGVTA